jgi:hypothetical protein
MTLIVALVLRTLGFDKLHLISSLGFRPKA